MKIKFKIPTSTPLNTTTLIRKPTSPDSEKRIIVTIMSGKQVELIGRSSIPFMRKLADAWNCSLGILRTIDVKDYAHPSCGKGEIWRFLKEGYRVCYMDLDTLTKSNCPNLFDLVPPGYLGMVERGKYWSEKHPCHSKKIVPEYIKKWNTIFPDNQLPELPDYNGKYYNAGVFVCDSTCFPLEEKNVPLINYKWEWIDQTLFNVLIAVKKIPTFELEWRFNATDGMLGFEGNAEELLRECYVRHYTVGKKNLIRDAKRLKSL